ncbi:hypothetical protein PENSPDRAFT_755943 [Peniophora sp. CONT]|nr:hypothetical protein PENSPDRAFT_755943 [Peniophora sp. CONT]
MAPLNLLDLNDDVLRAVSKALALVHPLHWEFPGSGRAHDWGPDFYRDSTFLSSTPAAKFCLGWIYASHVCARLRNIMLDTPSLWAGIIFALPSPSTSVIKTLVSRARDHLLNLILPVEDWCTQINSRTDAWVSRNNAKKTLIPGYIGRARVVDIWQYHDWGVCLGTRAYPDLRVLTIKHNSFDCLHRLEIRAPNLVVLALGYAVPCFPFSLPFLRKLNIYLPSEREGPEFQLIIDALNRTPYLEELDLTFHEYFWEHLDDPHWAPSTRVSLPNLRSATILRGNHSDTQPMWMYIDAPQTTKLELGYESQVPDRASTLAAASRQLTCAVYSRLRLAISYTWEFRLESDGDYSEARGVYYHEYMCETNADLVRVLPSYVDKQRIRHIELASAVNYDFRIPALGFLCSFPNVISLTVETDNGTAQDMWMSLLGDTSPVGPSQVLPAFDTLVIRHNDSHPQPEIEAPLHLLGCIWQAISRCLQILETGGKRVRRLVLAGKRHHWKSDRVRAREEREMGVAGMYVDEVVDERS